MGILGKTSESIFRTRRATYIETSSGLSRSSIMSSIVVDGKHHNLGRFHDEIAAAEAYDDAARKFFGEYARLNFPDGIDAALERAA